MTTTRTDLWSTTTTSKKVSKTEKNYSMRQKDREDNYGLIPFRRETYDVCRYVYLPDAKKTLPEAMIGRKFPSSITKALDLTSTRIHLAR
jgi:hypothetical protein